MTSHHTYKDSCLLKEGSNTFTRRASSVVTNAPKITAQFFYCSALPIDDPLAAVPSPSSGGLTRSSRVPPRPFSVRDNIALDEAWLKLQDAEQHPPRPIVETYGRRQSLSVSRPQGIEEKSGQTPQPQANELSPTEQHQQTCLTPRGGEKPVDLEETLPLSTDEIIHDEIEGGIPKVHKSRSFFHRQGKDKDDEEEAVSTRISARRLSRGRQEENETINTMAKSPDTTGTPFLRAPSRTRLPRSRSKGPESHKDQVDGFASPSRNHRPRQSSPLGVRPVFPNVEDMQDDEHSSLGNDRGYLRPTTHNSQIGETSATQVAVGITRLHVVEMSSLKMRPLYWDPVHDISSVVRGTWFYRDTMWPVESDLANQLEQGYEYIKPWTPTYVDELNSCIEHGPETELKVVHAIWPTEVGQSRPGSSKDKQVERQEADTIAELADNRAAGMLGGFEPPGTGRLFAKSSIIYANARDAQILRPGQLPSASKVRSPLGKIRKGKTVGIPVLRGFDMRAWEKINPLPNRAIVSPPNVEAGTAGLLQKQSPCLACTNERPVPTDLILVVHGIGQKLSERVESFHFTHAINAFRRQVNVELNTEAVKSWLRQDLGGVMVLPINWRSTLKLEDGGPEPDPNRRQRDADPMKNEFTLKDITAESLPAVRNLISDVMLDIPYYLSHHKPKMIEAVITEANRVYRLWCINNPGFHDSGRVHLLAHSLGSVMALDILSKQPTKLPREMSYPPRKDTRIRKDMLEFDTKSLFFCGSPAGFFLLLNRAPLLPRKDREKPDADGEDTNAGVAGQAGTFGCLAVDNLYNVMTYNDPVAYRLNACVDVDYAASLQAALVPSASPGWGQYLGSYFRGKAVAPNKNLGGLNELPRRPTTVVRLPTSVELETHNFTKEEIAEKRMFLLNDNGQIDYTLQSGGGPLEIPYYNMLTSHSSYWTLQDFIRFLVVEVGRQPGKSNTVKGFRATKKAFGKK